MPPDELIPRRKNELSLDKARSNEITSRMAEDLLAIKKDEVLDDAVVHFKCKNLEEALREELDIRDRRQIKYIAHCIKSGERCFTTFKTVITDQDELLSLGSGIASGWGAECISVKKDDDQSNLEDVWDSDNL